MVAGKLLGVLRTRTQKMAASMDELLMTYTLQGRFSGSVLVAKGGETLFSDAYGLANREHNISNTVDTVFRIGSMTKSFTALAIMRLVERGTLRVEDTIDRWFPDFPDAKSITIHHLLANRSGIPDYIAMPIYELVKKRQMPSEAMIALFKDAPRQFAPDADFSYSNSNWVLLGGILEQITGKSYGGAIRELILDPAGMSHSGTDWEQPIIPHRALGYVDTGAEFLNAEFIDDTTMHGAGAIYATAGDLLRWDRAIHNGTLVKPETFAQMSRAYSMLDKSGYGYGLELHTIRGRRAVGHSGGIPGYVAFYMHFDDADVTIIILSNLGSAAFPEITADLAAIVYGEPYDLPSERVFVQVDPAILADYAGDYDSTFFNRHFKLTFSVVNDREGAARLVMDVQGLPRSMLSAMSESKFYARSKGDVEMVFIRDTNGRVTHIDMNWAGMESRATRT